VVNDTLFLERALVYKVLSLALYTPSDQEAQRELRSLAPRLWELSALPLSRSTVEYFVSSWDKAWSGSQEALRVEYTRLFVNDYPELKCPPFETYWATGQRTIYGSGYESLLQLYRAAGLDRAPGVGLPLEHVALELELMYFLVLSSLSKPELLCSQERLFAEHISRWARPYSQCLEANATLDAYKATAKLLRELADAEEKFFAEHTFCA
jgi:TorA maturation chaperone TorD